jgi:hypothetical protein
MMNGLGADEEVTANLPARSVLASGERALPCSARRGFCASRCWVRSTDRRCPALLRRANHADGR